MRWMICLLAMLAFPSYGQGVEPSRGSPERAALLDAVRGVAEADLGAPVEFVVSSLRMDGDVAFAQVMAQRPGGGEINMGRVPLVTEQGRPVELIDGPRIEAFLVSAKGAWFVVDHATGATDVWWWGYRCDVFASVLPSEAC